MARGQSAYNRFVKRYMKSHTSGTPKQRMKAAAAAWRKKKKGGSTRRSSSGRRSKKPMVGKTPMIAAGLGALRQVIGGPLGAGAATVGAIVSGGVTNQAVTGYDLGRELAAVLAGGGSGGGLLGGILPGAGPQGGAL